MSRAVVADDEPHLAQYLCQRLAVLWPELEIAGVAAHGEQALELIDEHGADVAFLDITMPGLTGLDVARRLAGSACRVVFVTAYDQYALDAFEHHAVDYLLKPVSDERLARTIEHLRQSLATQSAVPPIDALLAQLAAAVGRGASASGYLRWIRASMGETVRQIAVDDVVLFKAADKYTIVVLRDGESAGEILIRMSLSDLLLQLDPENFWQVHRGTIVNAAKVESARRDVLGKTLLKIHGHQQEVVVSRQYAQRFRQM